MKFNALKTANGHLTWLSRFVLAVLAFVFLTVPFSVQIAQAGSFTSIKDLMTNSRPSVFTAITVAVAAGDTTINVANSNGFEQGDSVTLCASSTVCTGGTTESATIASIISQTQISLTVGTANTYTTSGYVLYKATSKHTITVTTRSTVKNGKFVITLAADSSPNNSIPGASGFDFNNISTTTSDIILSPGTASSTVATSTGTNTIVFTIPFSGTIASSSAQTITIGSTTPLLNPLKTAAQGTADVETVQVDEQDVSGNVIDTTQAQVATIEAVAVSATVTPSLNFTINATTTGATIAGVPMSATSTATTVPFGNLTVNATSTVAQYLHVDSNSNSGYIVTAQSNGSMRKTNGTVIPDYGLTAADNANTNGFGYALQFKAGNATTTFNYNDSGRTFNSAGFSSSSPVTVMSNTAPASGDEVWVAYRVRTGSTQAQGTYQTVITYIATATY